MENVKTFNKVSVIGLGYIGLPTAALLASRGVEVCGVDINPMVVDTINRGKIHIVEPGLDIVVQGVVNAKKLKASTQPESSDAFLLAVPTPFLQDRSPDLTYVQAAAQSIAPVLKKNDLIILESTSPVGTAEKLCSWLKELRSDLVFPNDSSSNDHDISIAYCPERVLPGKVIHELVANDRVIGGITANCSEKAKSFYKIFVSGECIETDSRTAEMVKLTENAFRDINIAFANELSVVCERLNIDVWKLIELANRHPRVSILNPGPGVGGHCISIDPWFIIHAAKEQTALMQAARKVNDEKPAFVLQQVQEKLASQAKNLTVLGLSFKANIDDLRESPAVEIVKELCNKKIFEKIFVAEPYIQKLPDELASFDNIELIETSSALNECESLLILVDHNVFCESIKQSKPEVPTVDTRGIT